MSSESDKKNLNALAAPLGLRSPLSPAALARNGLRDYFGRPEVTGLYYNGQKLVLDGYTFIRCRFDNCSIEVTSSNFDLIQCVIDPSTTISYGPDPLKIIKLFNSRFEWAYKVYSDFVPVRNEDGTITISDRA